VQLDCAALLDQHGAKMRRLGWSAEEACGIHPTSPWAAIHCYGLGPLLDGRKVVDLTATGATIEHAGGVRLTFARRPMPGVVAIWSVGSCS